MRVAAVGLVLCSLVVAASASATKQLNAALAAVAAKSDRLKSR